MKAQSELEAFNKLGEDGGLAYPIAKMEGWKEFFPGMNMRQAYKIAAIQGILAAPEHPIMRVKAEACGSIAKYAGRIADELLAEDEEHEKKARQ